MKYSYSNVSTASSCPYKWWLNYKEKLRTIPETNADTALYLGSALHKGIEEWSVEAGLEEYQSHYNIIQDDNINWMIQLEYQLPRVFDVLPRGGEHEIEVKTDDFIGFVDYVVGDTIYDFKFSNNVDKYLESPQLSIYKYYLEQVRPDLKINHLKFLFVPKSAIRQKKTESIQQFRQRLIENLENTEIQLIEVPYDELSVTQFQDACKVLDNITDVRQCKKKVTRLCDWCNFQKYCESNGKVDYMILTKEGDVEVDLPKNEKKEIKKVKLESLPDMYIYGASYVGKSTFVDSMKDVLFINTDGNYDMYENPSLFVGKTVTMNGRMKVEKTAWENFLEIIEELEKKQNTFKYVCLDLVEDLREHCRVYMCDKLKIAHESDSNFSKGWDMVTTEFNQAIKRIKAAGYKVIYISKEVAKEVTERSGAKYTIYNPNIQEKTANMLAGTVKMSARVYADDKGERWINLNPNAHEFGGGRYTFKVDKCKLDVDEVLKQINEADEKGGKR